MDYLIIQGIDLVNVNRIVFRVLENDINFLERLFTPAEVSYCQKKEGSTNQALSFAARLAVKGAVAKMLGLNYEAAGAKDIEVVNNALGQPEIRLYGEAEKTALRMGLCAEDISIATSHTADLAIANVVTLIHNGKEAKGKMGKVTVTDRLAKKPVGDLFGAIAAAVAAGLDVTFKREGVDYDVTEVAIFSRGREVIAKCAISELDPIPQRITIEFYNKHRRYLDRFTKAAEAAVQNEQVDIEIKVV